MSEFEDINIDEEDYEEIEGDNFKEEINEIIEGIRDVLKNIKDDIDRFNDKFLNIAPDGIIPFKIII